MVTGSNLSWVACYIIYTKVFMVFLSISKLISGW